MKFEVDGKIGQLCWGIHPDAELKVVSEEAVISKIDLRLRDIQSLTKGIPEYQHYVTAAYKSGEALFPLAEVNYNYKKICQHNDFYCMSAADKKTDFFVVQSHNHYFLALSAEEAEEKQKDLSTQIKEIRDKKTVSQILQTFEKQRKAIEIVKGLNGD